MAGPHLPGGPQSPCRRRPAQSGAARRLLCPRSGSALWTPRNKLRAWAGSLYLVPRWPTSGHLSSGTLRVDALTLEGGRSLVT